MAPTSPVAAPLTKRYCVQYVDGTIECFRDGFWYSDTGIIVKWVILASFFGFFILWFGGGYLHAKARLRKGKPLLGYHRFLVSYSVRKQHGQVPQNQYTYYTYPQQQGAYGPGQQRADGTWPEPPPVYGGDAPPGYGQAPPPPPNGASKTSPQQPGMEMGAMGQQGGNGNGFPELPPKPEQAKLAKLMQRFRR